MLPEDVLRSVTCTHQETVVCEDCDIPMCNECFRLAGESATIPRCLANDNFTGYVHDYIVENNVTWIAATIACPVFSGLVTYYIKGDSSQRGDMMQDMFAKPQRAWAVGGTCVRSYFRGTKSWLNSTNVFFVG